MIASSTKRMALLRASPTKSPGRAGASVILPHEAGRRRAERLLRHDADVSVLLESLLAELHPAVRLREQRVVGTATDVVARAINRAALTHDDVAGDHLLAAELLDTESFRL